MGERRRSPGVDHQQTAASTSTYRRGITPPQRSRTLPEPRRSDSLPASSYFLTTQGNDNTEPRPIVADAGSHFAYSTTLRRQNYELASPTMAIHNISHGNWQGALDSFSRGPTSRLSLDQPRPTRVPYPSKDTGAQHDVPETQSSKFSHSTIEVCSTRWHSHHDADCCHQETLFYFRTSPTEGLSSSAINSLREQYGYNEFSVAASEPLLVKFVKTIYETPLILLLCGSAFVSALMGNVDDAVSITVAVLIVLTVGFVQERRSEKRLEALNKLVPHHCHLLRDGKQLHLLANELLPGDVVTFTTGDRIPADVRILAAVDLEVDESSLTGETDARIKRVEPCPPGVPMAERSSIAHMGTLVKNGKRSKIFFVYRAEADV